VRSDIWEICQQHSNVSVCHVDEKNRLTATAGRPISAQAESNTHQADLSGHVLETGGWTHLKLPTRFAIIERL